MARVTWLDRAIGMVAPRVAVRRVAARATLTALQERRYEGAAGGRLAKDWRAGATSADAEIGSALPALRARHRDLVRNNPHARKAKTVWTNNLVGCGIVPRASSGDPDIDKRANELWDEWTGTADADGQLDLYGLQELAVATMVEGGEALIRRVLTRGDGRKVPLSIRVLEGDLLDHTRHGPLAGNGTIVQGVEFGEDGRRRAYWMHREHPGNNWVGVSRRIDSAPVPASEILHLYRKERTQTRGVPWGSAIITDLRDIDDYDYAERVRKKIESCVVGIVIGAEEGEEGIAPSVTDAAGNRIEQFEPGLIAYAHGGKDIKFNSPTAMGGYGEYKKVSLHDVAAGYLVPYELLTGDLSEVNFSSARVGLVEFRRLVETIQWLTVIQMAAEPMWRWFCEAAHLSGALPVPYVPAVHQPPRFESVNPIDDANAELIEIRSGTVTLFEAIAKRGRNPEEVLREHAAGYKLLDELGLVFDSDPRRVTRVGNEQPSQSRQAEEAAASGRSAGPTPAGRGLRTVA